MILTEPSPFTEAVEQLGSKGVLPSELNSQEMIDHTDAELREGSFFSSRVINAQLLQEFKNGAEAIVRGESSIPQQRLRLKQLLAKLRYQAPRGKEGTLHDLSSNARLEVMLRMNVSLVRGFGQWQQRNRHGELKAFPALELIRISPRIKKRDWIDRWNAARAALGDKTTATEAMGSEADDANGINAFALKNDPIWPAISRFGVPYPPFDYGSGMGDRAVGYTEAVEVGVMKPDQEPIQPKPRTLTQGFGASIEGLDDDLAAALQDSLSDDVELSDGILRFKNELARERGCVVMALINAYDPDQSRGASGRWISVAQLGVLHDRARKGLPVPTRGQNYREVTEAEAQRVQRATGLDIRGFTHSVDESALRHIVKEHGDPAKEDQRGLIAVTSHDLTQLPRIMARADKITREPDVQGMQRICYEKVEGHITIIVEEVRTGRRQLALVTMYKKKRAVLSSTSKGFSNAVWQTPEAFRAVSQRTTLRDRGQAVLRYLEGA